MTIIPLWHHWFAHEYAGYYLHINQMYRYYVGHTCWTDERVPRSLYTHFRLITAVTHGISPPIWFLWYYIYFHFECCHFKWLCATARLIKDVFTLEVLPAAKKRQRLNIIMNTIFCYDRWISFNHIQRLQANVNYCRVKVKEDVPVILCWKNDIRWELNATFSLTEAYSLWILMTEDPRTLFTAYSRSLYRPDV